MKKEVINEFKNGLNFDLNPIVTPNTVLTDNLNGTFITYNGNEFCLQNDRGNVSKASLTPGYVPIGIKEHNGILYIVSNNGTNTEIGVYPGLGTEQVTIDEEIVTVYKFKYDLYTPLTNTTPTPSPLRINDYSTSTPITIEVQDSYDGSVNLILVAEGYKPRIINTGFSKVSDITYELITRNKIVGTNLYNLSTIASDSELIRTSTEITNFDLLGVQSGGQLKGGNYTFYLKFGDGDYNKTDIVAESGIVSIFKGNDGVPSTISGTLLDERTDKMIQLKITGIDTKYSKLYLYYTREYSDTQGYRMTESCALIEPIDIKDDRSAQEITQELPVYQKIWITGFEQVEPINIEELNVDYHTIDWARAEAQHSNMLFLGNVGQKETFELYHQLEEYSKTVTGNPVVNNNSNLGYVNTYDFSISGNNTDEAEYYSVKNIYEKLGYWPNEYYRFGIVYILNDGSTTPVFNIKGNVPDLDTNYNLYGVFKTPDVAVLNSNKITPIYFTFNVPSNFPDRVNGYFIVRQKRIPLTICQGLAIGIDNVSHTPLISNGNEWITESFISHKRVNFGPSTANMYGKEYNPVLIYNDLSIVSETDSSSPDPSAAVDDSNKTYYIFNIWFIIWCDMRSRWFYRSSTCFW